jgi:asparagine synthase (glutamine-hydrolysing)
MCGIAGIIGPRKLQAAKERMEEMLRIQNHRGPDSSGVLQLDEHIIFGHNRLSIIDLSSEASQPFASNDGRWHLVFNGEIYNYRELRTELQSNYPFRTHSDTEVLLASWIQWGVSCLDKLRGMFAFAIYDQQEKLLSLVRDRFGVKPIYYAMNNEGELLFASEIKTLFAGGIKKEPNASMWSSYFTKGSFQFEDKTFWEGVHALQAGHLAEISLKGSRSLKLEARRWYDFVHRIQALHSDTVYLNRSEYEHLHHYQLLLEESIRLRFRADVPVGFNISGGLDSSVLLGAVNKLYPAEHIQAFSFYTGDDRYDELPWVEALIAETNKPLNKVQLGAAEVPDLSESVSYFQDEPYGGIPTLAYSKIFAAAREKGVIVLLDGQGMDEAWAGYDYYHQISDSVVQGVQSSPLRPEVLDADFAARAYNIQYPQPFDEALLNKQYRDLFYTKIPRALRFNDRISMMHSTELREPFLDHLLVEYAFALPVEMKVQNQQSKWALRKLAGQYLSGGLHLAPKRPLQTPQREWLTEDLKGWVKAKIEGLQEQAWFKAGSLMQEWNTFLQTDRDNTFFVWQWCSLEAFASLTALVRRRSR